MRIPEPLHGSPLDTFQVFKLLCRSTAKWGLYLSGGHADPLEAEKAAPILSFQDHPQQVVDGFAILLYDDEGSCRAAYDRIVGDDGPTKTNPYDGPARWYALTCDPAGQFRTENT